MERVHAKSCGPSDLLWHTDTNTTETYTLIHACTQEGARTKECPNCPQASANKRCLRLGLCWKKTECCASV